MVVKVTNFTENTCAVKIGDKYYPERVIENKYDNNTVLVSIKNLHGLLGDGEHKNWLVVSKKQIELNGEVDLQTEKAHYDAFLTEKNISKYLSPEDYGAYLVLRQKAELALKEYQENYKKGE